MNQSKTTTSKPDAVDQPRADGARVALTHEESQKVGFFGREVDPTPDENYSALTPSDAPTPENDAAAFTKAQQAAGLGAHDKFGDQKGGQS